MKRSGRRKNQSSIKGNRKKKRSGRRSKGITEKKVMITSQGVKSKSLRGGLNSESNSYKKGTSNSKKKQAEDLE